MDPIEHYTEAFIRSGGKKSSSIKVTPLAHMGGGYGLIAEREISEDEVVVSVPDSLVLVASKYRNTCKLPESASNVLTICIFLMKKRLSCIENYLKQQCKSDNTIDPNCYPDECAGLSLAHFKTLPNTKSKKLDRNYYSLWISRLPSQYDNIIEIHPFNSLNRKIFKNEDEKAEYEIPATIVSSWMHEYSTFHDNIVSFLMPLLGSLRYCNKVAREIRNWRTMANDSLGLFPKIPPIIAKAIRERRSKLPKCIAKKLGFRRIMIEFFGWAFCTLMSRGFSHDIEIWSMMPWVDYFNFSHKPNVCWNNNYKKGIIEFTAIEKIRKGQELVIRYGSYSDFELLKWYGFTLCQSSVKIPKSLDSTQSLFDWNHQLKCSYILSPLADVNGKYDSTTIWLENIITGSGLHVDIEKVKRFCTVGIYGVSPKSRFLYASIYEYLGPCFITRNSISAGLYTIICRISRWLEMPRSFVLLKILLFEFKMFWHGREHVCEANAVHLCNRKLICFDDFRQNILDSIVAPEFSTANEEPCHFLNIGNPVVDSCRLVRNDIQDLLYKVCSLELSELESMLGLHDDLDK